MTELSRTVERLREQLLIALNVEEELTERLRSQGAALAGGSPDAILAASQALDAVYSELKRVSYECRDALFELLEVEGLPASTALPAVMKHLPAEQVERIHEPTRRLRRTRRAARELSMQNAAVARSSLDAIATVRGIVSSSLAESGSTAIRTSLSRLDSHA